MTCAHQRETSYWQEAYTDDWGTYIPAEWVYRTEHTTEDIDTGRYRCTQCGKVMYYTGRWREFYELTKDKRA